MDMMSCVKSIAEDAGFTFTNDAGGFRPKPHTDYPTIGCTVNLNYKLDSALTDATEKEAYAAFRKLMVEKFDGLCDPDHLHARTATVQDTRQMGNGYGLLFKCTFLLCRKTSGKINTETGEHYDD